MYITKRLSFAFTLQPGASIFVWSLKSVASINDGVERRKTTIGERVSVFSQAVTRLQRRNITVRGFLVFIIYE